MCWQRKKNKNKNKTKRGIEKMGRKETFREEEKKAKPSMR
jgi:hypothetical protein